MPVIQLTSANIMPGDFFDTARPYFAVTLGAAAANTSAKMFGTDSKYSSVLPLAAVTVVR
ncbi:MAG TPA: hypothetical protein VHT51_10510 [Micropepsaceae bacterium]|jgi:hypothetical protein|nr:hypothetical protein [Micropepsaceae bacterium]